MTYLSVLLPTRQRTHLVQRSLASLIGKARNPNDIEVLIVYDDDDQQSQDFFSHGQWTTWCQEHGINAKAFAVPKMGYRNLHEYYNYLVKHAQGSWFLMWGDDALMETDHWDDHVRANDDWRMLLHITCSNLVMNCSIFPLFHRDWIDLFGTISPINHPDSWISEICWQSRARKVIPVSTFHDRADLTGNNKDETFLARQYTPQEFKSEAMTTLRKQWAEKLQQHLKQR